MLTNTEYFREAAKTYEKYGYYTNAPFKSAEWKEYWREQKRRCIEGYKVGDTQITGYHYFYLNFTPILKVPDHLVMGDSSVRAASISSRPEGFPAFWDGDYEFFWIVDIAKNGLLDKDGNQDWDFFNSLNLDIKVLDISGGKHVVVLKARGKGYSYKAGSMLACNYFHGRKSVNYALAQLEEFLIKDGILSKAWDTIDFVDSSTGWTQPRVSDQDMHIRAAKKTFVNGTWVERGLKNDIMGIAMKSDTTKASGKRGDLMFYEEAGKFPNIDTTWEVNRPSFEQDSFVFGTQIAFGTGGASDADFSGLKKMFDNPNYYNCIAIENKWEPGLEGTYCGYFVPNVKNKSGFMDKDGNSYEEEALKEDEKIREEKKQSGDAGAYELYLAKHPNKPSEAAMEVDTNIFPTSELTNWSNLVTARGLSNTMGSPGWLVREDGRLRFKVDFNAKPYYKFPVEASDDKTGAIVIYQAPETVNGKVPDGLYIVCHDPYAQDKTYGPSLGSTYVIKRVNNFSKPDDMIVASYVARPNTMDEYNHNMFKLAEFYNAKIGFENDRGDVVGYAKRFNKLDWLQEEFQLMSPTDMKRKGINRKYGMHMTQERKMNGESYIDQWVRKARGVDDEGNYNLNLHMIYDPGLLEELKKFRRDKGNFDRVMSIMVGMYFLMELHDYEAGSTPSMPEEDWFDQLYNGVSYSEESSNDIEGHPNMDEYGFPIDF